jgi:hypothetical protein
LTNAVNAQEGCQVVGKIKLHKVPSTIFVTTEQQQWQIQKLISTAPEAAKNLNLAHYFRKFTFLNAEGVDLEDLKMRFSEYPEHLNFDLAPKAIPQGEGAELNNYFKFCKLVAHSYVDELDRGHERDFQTWQYSLTSNKKPNANRAIQYMQI